ncbi:MAG: SRPBCC family protein [Paracoccaceae bacterium]
MTLSTKITVAAPASEVWSVLLDDYMALDTWMAAIDRTRPLTDSNDNTLARIAEIGAGAPGAWLEETAKDVNPSRRSMTIVTELKGLPKIAPLKGYTSKIRVHEISPSQTEVTWDATADIKFFAVLFSAPLKKGLTAGFFRGIEELKHFVETGKPHPRKQKAFDRLEQMAAT